MEHLKSSWSESEIVTSCSAYGEFLGHNTLQCTTGTPFPLQWDFNIILTVIAAIALTSSGLQWEIEITIEGPQLRRAMGKSWRPSLGTEGPKDVKSPSNGPMVIVFCKETWEFHRKKELGCIIYTYSYHIYLSTYLPIYLSHELLGFIHQSGKVSSTTRTQLGFSSHVFLVTEGTCFLLING